MIICEDIFAIFIYTDIAMMLKLQYSFNKWDSSRFIRGKNEESHMETLRLYLPDAVETALFRIIYDTPCSPLVRLLSLGGSS